MDSLRQGVKPNVPGDIINRIGGTPFHKAVEELCVAVIELLPDLPEDKTVRLGRALGNLQEASLSQTTSTAAATIVAAAKGLTESVDALRKECKGYHQEMMAAFAAQNERLNTLEAGK